MNTAATIAANVPLAKFVMASDLNAKDVTDFQKFIDIGVQQGVICSSVAAKSILKAF
jgi:NitT/TauT family transport system substrate-binding protein